MDRDEDTLLSSTEAISAAGEAFREYFSEMPYRNLLLEGLEFRDAAIPVWRVTLGFDYDGEPSVHVPNMTADRLEKLKASMPRSSTRAYRTFEIDASSGEVHKMTWETV